MNLKQLGYFLKIVDCRSITRAAQELHVAQPALSHQMTQLEQELDTRLLTRSVQGVSATETGMLLYRHAKGILRQVDATRTVLRQSMATPTGKVSLTFPSSTGRLVAIALLREAGERYPGISLELLESPSAELRAMVLQGRVDLAITIGSDPARGLVEMPLLREDLYVVTHPDMALPAAMPSLGALSDLRFVFPGRPNTIRITAERLFAEAGLSLKVIAEVNTTPLLVSAVASGLAATILPWSAVHEEASQGRVRLSRLQAPPLHRPLSLCHAELLPLSPASGLIADLLHDLVRRQVVSGAWQGAHWVGDSDAGEATDEPRQ